MTDELDEGLPHRLPHHRVGCHDVGDGEERKEDPDADDFQGLQDHIFSAEAGQALVPDGGQQLLDVGMCYELQQKDTMAHLRSLILYGKIYVYAPQRGGLRALFVRVRKNSEAPVSLRREREFGFCREKCFV